MAVLIDVERFEAYLSELLRKRPNRGVVGWASTVSFIRLSVVTREEIEYGLAWKPNPRVRAWFERFFTERCEILPVSTEISERSGQLRGQLRASGTRRTQADMLIAATALEHRLTLVTRNQRDFAECGVPLLNPFR